MCRRPQAQSPTDISISRDHILDVCARWFMFEETLGHPDKIHHYDVLIKPAAPLQVGINIRLRALSRVAYHSPQITLPRYETYDPHIIGKIVAVAHLNERTVTFDIENECRANSVRRVYITIQRWDGVTTVIREDEAGYTRPNSTRHVPLATEPLLAEDNDLAIVCGGRQCQLQPPDAPYQRVVFLPENSTTRGRRGQLRRM